MGLKYRAVACAWMVILMQGLDAGHVRTQRHTAACRPKEMTALTRRLVDESLTGFEEANGKHLGSWSPGFPELQVHHNAAAVGSEVQCSLFFMAGALKEVLDDQKNNLNPKDVSLHQKLREAISNVNLLETCLKTVLQGECSPKPSLPTMPEQAFERKQFGHTLLKRARHYLEWLQGKLVVHGLKTRSKGIKVTPLKYLEGSRYQL